MRDFLFLVTLTTPHYYQSLGLIHKASLPDTGREEEVRHYPTLILGKGAFLDIRLFEKCLKLCVGIGFDMAFIHLDSLHLKVRNPTLIHEKMNSRYEIPKIRIDTDIIIKSCFKVQNVVLIDLLVDVLNGHPRVEELIEI